MDANDLLNDATEFGRVSVNPWYTLGLDVIAVAALLRYRPERVRSVAPAAPWRVRLAAVAGLVQRLFLSFTGRLGVNDLNFSRAIVGWGSESVGTQAQYP